ncbi:MAG: hypothetical protein AAF368_07850 [Planctomycetota bacterium]
MSGTRTEPRTLSPFFALGGVEELLDAAEIVLRPGEDPRNEERIVLEPDELRTLAPTILPNIGIDDLTAALGDAAKDFDLILTVETPQFLRRALVDRWSCDTEPPRAEELSQDIIADGLLSGVLEIGLSICLREDTPPEAGRPELAGARVASKAFSIGIERRQNTFAFDELTDELRRKHRLPDETTYLIAADPDDLTHVPEDDRPIAVVYLTSNVLSSLRSGALKPTAVTFLLVEILDAVLEEVAKIDAATEPEEGSGIARLVEWASEGGTKVDWKTLRDDIGDPGRRRAFVQHRLGLNATLLGAR